MKIDKMSLDESFKLFTLLDLRGTLRYLKLNDHDLKYLDLLRAEINTVLKNKYNIKDK